MTAAQEINARGLARGWHAEQLELRAKRMDMTMADAFAATFRNGTVAYNVPAECIKVTSAWITYRFTDGSIGKYPNTNGGQ